MIDYNDGGIQIFLFFVVLIFTIFVGVVYSSYHHHIETLQETDKCFELFQAIYSNSTKLNGILNQQIQSYEQIPSTVTTKISNVINERCSS